MFLLNNENNFKGQCVKKIDGEMVALPFVKLDNLEACVKYVMLHKPNFDEVIIEDEDGFCILHAEGGKIVFPKEFAGR